MFVAGAMVYTVVSPSKRDRRTTSTRLDSKCSPEESIPPKK